MGRLVGSGGSRLVVPARKSKGEKSSGITNVWAISGILVGLCVALVFLVLAVM